jgi:hypothetical protein
MVYNGVKPHTRMMYAVEVSKADTRLSYADTRVSYAER